MNYNYKITKKYMDKLEAQIKDLQSRIDKAINYIKQNKYKETNEYNEDNENIVVEVNELLEILKGENDDNNSNSN